MVADIWNTIPDLPNVNAVITSGVGYADRLKLKRKELNLNVDIFNYPKGIYIVKIISMGEIDSQKIIIQ